MQLLPLTLVTLITQLTLALAADPDAVYPSFMGAQAQNTQEACPPRLFVHIATSHRIPAVYRYAIPCKTKHRWKRRWGRDGARGGGTHCTELAWRERSLSDPHCLAKLMKLLRKVL